MQKPKLIANAMILGCLHNSSTGYLKDGIGDCLGRRGLRLCIKLRGVMP